MIDSEKTPTRDEAWQLLSEWTLTPGLRGHALAVEAAMREYAEHFGEDPDVWGVIGLLHDFDYERYPSAEDHPFRGAEELRRRGVDDEIVQTIMSHANYSGIPRETTLMRTLFAVDELCGLIIATALVQPDRKLEQVTVSSVKKKMKRKDFARSVNRDDILNGADELGVGLDEHIDRVLHALKSVAPVLGL